MLTLRKAIDEGTMAAFIEQAEKEGVGSISHSDFDEMLGRVVKVPLPVDQTSRSRGRGGSTGK